MCKCGRWEDRWKGQAEEIVLCDRLLSTQSIFQSEVRSCRLSQNYMWCFLEMLLLWHCPRFTVSEFWRAESRTLHFKWAPQIFPYSKAWALPFLLFVYLFLHLQCLPWASQLMLVVRNPPANAGEVRDAGLSPGSGRSPGGGHGNPLQYSCLKNPMDRGTWWATVYRSQRVRHNPKPLSTCNVHLLPTPLAFLLRLGPWASWVFFFFF